jgi:DnaK suppressor protein
MAAKKPVKNTKTAAKAPIKAKSSKAPAAKKPVPAPKSKQAPPPVKAKSKPAASKTAAGTKSTVKPISKPVQKKTTPAPAKTASKASVKAAPKAPIKVAAKAPAKAASKPTSKAIPVKAAPVAAKAAPKAAPEKAVATPAAKPVKGAKKVPVGPIVTTVRRGIIRPPMDDDDGDMPRNLLAGPRNVTPYHAKKGEVYMGKTQIQHFRTILSSWKRDLMEEVDRTMIHMKDEAANPPDPNDRATLESEFSLELRTRDRERKLIRKIDEAIARVDDGSYGYCLETGEEIGIKRLEARPVATLSIEAQERRERREKQYGDRDDRYR